MRHLLRVNAAENNLGQGVPSVAGLLRGVLLLDDVPPRGHGTVQQRLLHVLLPGGQQLSDHGHQLPVLDQGHVAVHPESQVALKK